MCGTRCLPPRSLLPNQNRPSIDWRDESTDLPEVRVTRSFGRVVRVQMCVETDAPPPREYVYVHVIASHPNCFEKRFTGDTLVLCCRIRIARLLVGWMNQPISRGLGLLDLLAKWVGVRICAETDAPVLGCQIRIARLLIGWMNRSISQRLNRPSVDWMDESTDLPEVRVFSIPWRSGNG